MTEYILVLFKLHPQKVISQVMTIFKGKNGCTTYQKVNFKLICSRYISIVY